MDTCCVTVVVKDWRGWIDSFVFTLSELIAVLAVAVGKDKICMGVAWELLASALRLVVIVIGADVIVAFVPGLTAENCLSTWDRDEFAVWCGNIGTACWTVCKLCIGEEDIEIICDCGLLALALANNDLTVWLEDDVFVRLATVAETTWGLFCIWLLFIILALVWLEGWLEMVVPDDVAVFELLLSIAKNKF